MVIKANRTPHHQPEGSPGYADHPSLTPLRRGFFFSAHLRLGKSIIPDLRGAPTDRVRIGQKVVPGERFELPTNGLQNRTVGLTWPNPPSQKPLTAGLVLPDFPSLLQKSYATLPNAG